MNSLVPSLCLAALLATSTKSPASAGPGPYANGAYYPGQLDGRYFASAYNNADGSFKTTVTTNTFFVTNTTNVVIVVPGMTNATTTNFITGPFSSTQKSISGSVVSGLIAFGIRDGTPSFASVSTAAGSSTNATSASELRTLGLDRSHNYFLIYVNGDVFVGTTAADINPANSKVTGVLVNGAGRDVISRVTNTGTSVVGPGGATTVAFSIPSATANGYFNANVKNNKSPYTFKGDGTLNIASASGEPSYLDGEHTFKINGIKVSSSSSSGYPSTGGATASP